MHRRLRIAFSTRLRLLKEDVLVCEATISHIDTCNLCEADEFCPAGENLYQRFLLAKSRSKLLRGDDV